MEHRLGTAIAAAVCVFLGATACAASTDAPPSTSSGSHFPTASSPVTSASSDNSTDSEVTPSTVASTPSRSVSAASSTRSPTSSQSTVARISTPTEIAKAQVKAFVPTYFAALDQIRSSSKVPLSKLDKYAIDPERAAQANAFSQYRAHGWTQVGTTKLAPVRVVSEDLKTEPPTVKVATCVDVRAVKEIDQATGKTVTLPSRPDFLIENLTVVNTDHLAASSWRVSWETNKGAKSCSGF